MIGNVGLPNRTFSTNSAATATAILDIPLCVINFRPLPAIPMDLYAIRVVKKEREKITLKVYVTYDDGEDRLPQAELKFFLGVLTEQLPPMNRRPEQLPPLAQEVLKAKRSKSESIHDTLDHFLDMQDDARPNRYISEIQTIEEHVVEREGDGFTTWSFDEDEGQFGVAESEITWVLFELTMTDEKWIAHLQEGKLFGTASYFD